jgi:inactivated superfamily I helicase
MTATRMTPEPEDGLAPWSTPIRAAYQALLQRDVKAARQAWEEAHLAAVGSARWDGLIEVGDAYLRIGLASGSREAAEATARKAYFAALFRACQKESFDGILRTAEAFAALGDRQVVEECTGLAELLAPDDNARGRVRGLLARFAVPAPATGGLLDGLAPVSA